MSLKVGIVGLPNVGKSTLFNALLKKRVALSANYPFATIEPNTGVVAVSDERLEKLAWLVAKEEGMIPKDKEVQDDTLGVEARKYLPPIIPAVVEFVDIAGLVKGASTGAGLGNQFLSHIREVDAIIHVVRVFEDSEIIREGSADPISDYQTITTELILADLQTIQKALENKKIDPFKKSTLEDLRNLLNAGNRASYITSKYFNDQRKEAVKDLMLLTNKPELVVLNVSENTYCEESEQSIAEKYSLKLEVSKTNIIMISAKMEQELSELPEEDQKDYLLGYSLDKPGLERLIIKAYSTLDLISFLTAGKKEVRAWTIKQGTKAPQAAGVIHTDFEKGFIRAQVIEYEKLVEAGSYASAKQKGWMRTEGKDYIVKDGDVVEFLVSS